MKEKECNELRVKCNESAAVLLLLELLGFIGLLGSIGLIKLMRQ